MKLLERIQTRYSIRSFLPTQVEKKIDYLLECARWAPSAVRSTMAYNSLQQENNKTSLHQCLSKRMVQTSSYVYACVW